MIHSTSASSRINALLLFLAVFLVLPLPAQTVQQLSDVRVDGFNGFAIDDTGTALFFVSSVDLGSNPEHSHQLFESDLAGGLTQATSLPKGTDGWVSVSDDGSAVAFVSPSDPLGTNHDGSLELFLMSSGGTTIDQLTDDPAFNAGSVGPIMLSGSGNRVLFMANTDPLGSNPSHHEQLFVVDTDGTNLTQLTSATGDGVFAGQSISDDGGRVAFSYSGDLTGGNADLHGEIFAVTATGSGLTQLTSSPGDLTGPALSGNGSQIVYESGTEIHRIAFGGLGAGLVAVGSSPSITDDGKWVYYSESDGGNQEIWVAAISGAVSTQLTFTDSPLFNHFPLVSGGNTHVVFSSSGWEFPGGNNPDRSPELIVMQASGANPQQLTDNGPVDRQGAYEPEITPDGTRAVYLSNGPESDVIRVQTDGSESVQLTHLAGATDPSITADGGTIAFAAWLDLTGENSCLTPQVFTVLADGSGMQQLTPADNCDFNLYTSVDDAGSVIVFQSTASYGGATPGGSDLFAVPVGGGAITVVADDGDDLRKNPHVSGNGQWATYHSASDFDGLNPDGSWEVFRARVDGTGIERVTADPDGSSFLPDISADGNRIAYRSDADPLGTNPDLNYEIFLWDATGPSTQQLTFTTDADNTEPRISGDGAYVVFQSDFPFFDDFPDLRDALYRVAVAGGVIERISGLRDPREGFYANALRNFPNHAVDGQGGIVFAGYADSTGENLDLNQELWYAARRGTGVFEPSRRAPTLVQWTPQPGPIRYDVIRGDGADLQAGAGGTVDLGTVVCLEDDSPDNHTAGFEDVDQPVSGQLFFYLYRGTQGGADGPGSWGAGSGDAERAPSNGSCLPAS